MHAVVHAVIYQTVRLLCVVQSAFSETSYLDANYSNHLHAEISRLRPLRHKLDRPRPDSDFPYYNPKL